MKNLNGATLEAFKHSAKWWVFLLPTYLQNMMIVRWFNHNGVNVDIIHWNGSGFDFAVSSIFKPDRIYMSDRTNQDRYKLYDTVVAFAVIKANAVYNSCPL